MFKVASFIAVFLVLTTNWRADAQRKCDCRVVRCAGVDARTCKYGVGLNACGCCQVCLLGPGATCGGPADIEGKYGTGLTCVKRDVTKSN
ncbi:single insulin-like growth factor-binding domain protein-1 [Hyalella azteca]|uniref:Single insulin-like growth factor-binding domain protein-1 n=1 Tax=Hyalella azteca TaxID=294128 RepID=A0A979FPV7_HYAAZ|nr:single insulin-like growth factor-binding domain protein-1 [Hyalella azteca]